MTTEYTTEYWLNAVEQLGRDFAEGVPGDFIHHPLIMETMFANDPQDGWPTELLNIAVDHFGYERTVGLVEEPLFGSPPQKIYQSDTGPVRGSHNNIQQLAHVAQWEKATGRDSITHVVEWGGGFGNMARLMHKLYTIESYTIIDLPQMNAIQHEYLTHAEVYGVKLIASEDVDNVSTLLPDGLFVSTWALSECKRAALDYVADKKFFGADHLLMAAQDASERFESAGDLVDLATNCDYDVKVVPFRSGASDIYILS